MALTPFSQKQSCQAIQKVPPSNPKEGDTWFNLNVNDHYVYLDGQWQRIFDVAVVLGPHTYNVNVNGFEIEAMVKTSPLINVNGFEIEAMVKI